MVSIKNLFSKSTPEEIREEIAEACGENSVYKYLTYKQLLEYYSKVSAVSTCIDKISTNVSRITPILVNEKGEEQPDHPLIKLLKNPNQNKTFQEFMKEMTEFYLIMGDVFLSGTAISEGSEFKNLYVRNPANITSSEDGTNEVNRYTLNLGSTSIDYNRDAILWRYNSPDKRSELSKVKSNDFRDRRSISTTQKALYEVFQYLNSSDHNSNLLKNGARLLNIITLKGNVSDDKYKKFIDSWKKLYTGSNNSGKSVVARASDGMDLQQLGQSNVDLDFLNSRKDVRKVIANAFDVPIELIDDTSSTFNNKAEAKLSLMEDNVLPLTEYLYGKIQWFNSERFDLEGLTLTFNKDSIPAFQKGRVELIDKKAKTGIYTVNELRVESGMEELDDGQGDKLTGTSSSTSDIELDIEKQMTRLIEKNVK